MLKARIIPVILYRDYAAVKSERFDGRRQVGFVRQQVKIHERRQSDEIFLLDVGATPGGREPNWGLISDLTAECMTPVCIGGGIRTLEHIRLALHHGADKVAIGTQALKSPEFIRDAACKFGSQAVVVSIDVLNGRVVGECGKGKPGPSPEHWARKVASYGAGEILLTCVERDGMMCGYDTDLIERISSLVSIPVIACGGAGSYDHMLGAFRAGAHAVAASAMWSFLDQTQIDAASYLYRKGVEVRLYEAA